MNEIMLAEMLSQPETLAAALVDLRKQAARIHTPGMSRLVLTGSGDSGYAAMAIEDLYLDRLSVPVWAVPSMIAARYPKTGPRDVVVPISVSGEVVRTIEVARTAKARGSTTLAIVANGASTLAQECDASLVMPKPITRATPHTRDYTTTLLALGVLGESLSGSSWPELDAWVDAVGTLMDASMQWTSKIDVPPAPKRVWFLGSGPDRGTAAYGALKFWEAGGALSWWDDLEEFAHGSHLQARPGDDVVVLATGRTWSRAAEMVPGLVRMQMRPLVIADREPLMGVPHEHQFQVPVIGDSAHVAFSTCFPVQAIAYRYACARNVDVLVPMGGAPYGQTYEEVHNEWMRKSKLEPEP